MPTRPLRIVILKPSKYGPDGYVERFRRGFMPNSTVPYLRSMTPADVDGVAHAALRHRLRAREPALNALPP